MFCRISEYLRCRATFFASNVTVHEAAASLQACRPYAHALLIRTAIDELDCRNRKFARTVIAGALADTRQRCWEGAGLRQTRDTGKAAAFT
jgi:hypothetical protein